MSDITPVIGSSPDWRSIDGKRGDVVRGELVLTGDLDVDLSALSGWTVVGVERVPEPSDDMVVSGDLAEFREWLTRLEANHRRWADTAVAFTRGIGGNPYDAGLRFYKALPALLAEVETLRKATPLVPEVPRGRAVNASTSYDATDGAAPEVPRPYRCGGPQSGQPKPHTACNCTPRPEVQTIRSFDGHASVPTPLPAETPFSVAATRTPEPPDSGPRLPDSEPMERCCTLTGCKCRYAPSQRGTGHDHARVGCRVRAEPPDSGDGAARALHEGIEERLTMQSDPFSRRESIHAYIDAWLDSQRDGIDADALAVAIRRTRTTSRLYRQDRLAAPLIAEYLAWRDPRNVLRSGSPAPEGGE